jgi:hypothetical protein
MPLADQAIERAQRSDALLLYVMRIAAFTLRAEYGGIQRTKLRCTLEHARTLTAKADESDKLGLRASLRKKLSAQRVPISKRSPIAQRESSAASLPGSSANWTSDCKAKRSESCSR